MHNRRAVDRSTAPVDTTHDTMNRRTYLSLVGTATAGTFAGCSTDGGPETDEPDSQGDETDDEEYVDPKLVVDDYVLKAISPIQLLDAETGNLLTEVHWHGETGHWHMSPLAVPQDQPRAMLVRFVREEDGELPIGDAYSLTVSKTEDTPDGLIVAGVNGPVMQIQGQQPGSGKLVIRLWRGEEEKFVAPPLQFDVV